MNSGKEGARHEALDRYRRIKQAAERRLEEDLRAMEKLVGSGEQPVPLGVDPSRKEEVSRKVKPSRMEEVPRKVNSSRKEELWRWLGLTVGGTMLPFAVAAAAYRLAAGHRPSLPEVLGRGELFIPASIMNAEAIWIAWHVRLWGRSVWLPIVFITCGLAALAGAVSYGATSALDTAPHKRVHVTQTTLHQLAKTVAAWSAREFLLAFGVGTIAAVLFMLTGRRKEGPAS